MTNRLKGLVVTFDTDIREDDAEAIISAIYQIRHVINVKPVITNFEDNMNRTRAKYELRSKLFALLDED